MDLAAARGITGRRLSAHDSYYLDSVFAFLTCCLWNTILGNGNETTLAARLLRIFLLELWRKELLRGLGLVRFE